tara:strand:+ start:249 stop:560 length:312 start_codon:yes stop_codon:yes gene_type:complete
MEQNQDKITFEEEYYDNGQLRYKWQYLNYKIHGDQFDYYSNGKLNYKTQYLNDKPHGEQLRYHKNGKLWYKSYCINGKKVSEKEWIEYIKPQHDTQFLTDLYV